MGELYLKLDGGATALDACTEPCSQTAPDMSVASQPTDIIPESQSSSYSLAEALLDHPGFRKLYKLFSDSVPWW